MNLFTLPSGYFLGLEMLTFVRLSRPFLTMMGDELLPKRSPDKNQRLVVISNKGIYQVKSSIALFVPETIMSGLVQKLKWVESNVHLIEIFLSKTM